jgi:hypothetical protein
MGSPSHSSSEWPRFPGRSCFHGLWLCVCCRQRRRLLQLPSSSASSVRRRLGLRWRPVRKECGYSSGPPSPLLHRTSFGLSIHLAEEYAGHHEVAPAVDPGCRRRRAVRVRSGQLASGRSANRQGARPGGSGRSACHPACPRDPERPGLPRRGMHDRERLLRLVPRRPRAHRRPARARRPIHLPDGRPVPARVVRVP